MHLEHSGGTEREGKEGSGLIGVGMDTHRWSVSRFEYILHNVLYTTPTMFHVLCFTNSTPCVVYTAPHHTTVWYNGLYTEHIMC